MAKESGKVLMRGAKFQGIIGRCKVRGGKKKEGGEGEERKRGKEDKKRGNRKENNRK